MSQEKWSRSQEERAQLGTGQNLGRGRGRVWQNSRQWALGLSISKLSAPWCLGTVAVSVVHGGCSVLLELDYF